MTRCPIAIAVGCRKCPIFKLCPVKGVIGDMRDSSEDAPEKPKAAAKKTRAAKKKA
jgi:hypothetical protein